MKRRKMERYERLEERERERGRGRGLNGIE
jgi:hypothetical protein